ncbi:MAG: SDR family oxidoreductase [Bacteroidales bacterium]|nr:SDR family oxidoreductase [Bacteroidales bacterium]
MNILLTGATGYIGRRLLPILLNEGHHVVCVVRDKNRFDSSRYDNSLLSVVEVDFLKKETLTNIPSSIDVAYYLIHSMSTSTGDFEKLERESAQNFRDAIGQTEVKQVIYLSGIINNKELSKHLTSRKAVEEILKKGSYHLTTLRAGIIVGSGSASFEIIRDLVEKLPLMVAPRWLKTRSQPIAVQNVLEFLTGVLMMEKTYDKNFDIGGPDILTYKDMLLRFAHVRNLKRRIFIVPVMTPKLSSYWLYFITSTSYKLAVNLVNSMKIEVIAGKNSLPEMLGIDLISYEDAVRSAFDKIEQQEVISSWTDAVSGNALDRGISQLINVPSYGCFKDKRQRQISNPEEVVDRIWSIGGENGWYYANWLWGIRGFLDKVTGGVGLRRGRRSRTEISAGDALDFWRVIYASKEEKRLLLFAEMKLPGEAWLEFSIKDGVLHQTATFRPLGLWGRVYWFSVLPFHGIIFRGMIKRIAGA